MLMTRPVRHCLAALVLGLSAASACALDLGVHGTVFEIVEPDFRQAMVADAAQVDWSAIEDGRRESANRYLENLPRWELPTAERTRIAWTDMSFVVNEDVRVPVKDEKGDYSWKVLYRKGTVVNPLEMHAPQQAMLFFDGTSPSQVVFARRAAKAYEAGVMLIDTSGSHPDKMTDSMPQLVYQANDWLLGRFDVTHVPALVFAGKSDGQPRIGTLTLAAPYVLETLEPYWSRSLFTLTNDSPEVDSNANP